MQITSSYDLNRVFRVLVVDDNAEFRTVLTKQLEKMGGCVESAGEASSFLSKFTTSIFDYDFCIIDLQLPDLYGDKIISWLRESEDYKVCSMPILIITGFPTELAADIRLDGLTTALLSKPYEYSDLKEKVSRLLKGHKRIH
ncbi:response regulator [Sulfitobacter geojensis]|uniref:response regulator n=1 Tax=Sulfitobacter geojensis TaxID=1342299 RepID=UPI00248F56F3|nr:response regulator [Sulfitobacter geojensis]